MRVTFAVVGVVAMKPGSVVASVAGTDAPEVVAVVAEAVAGDAA